MREDQCSASVDDPSNEPATPGRAQSTPTPATGPVRHLLKRLGFFLTIVAEVTIDGALILALRAVMSWYETLGEEHFGHWEGFGRDVVDFMEIALSMTTAVLVICHIVLSLWGSAVRIWRSRND